jgi:hypothetical protein
VKSEEERDQWIEKLYKATRNRQIEEFYTKKELLGEGYFGKVYSGCPIGK